MSTTWPTQPIRADQFWNDTGVRLAKDARYQMTVVPDVGEPLHDAKFRARGIEGEA